MSIGSQRVIVPAVSPSRLRLLLNLYPPYLGAGVRVRRMTPDMREIDVEMRLRWYNRNYVGTHFGGNLYSMVDPFYMLMLMHNLGPGYVVWDKAARIDFVAPGRGTVRAAFRLDQARIDEIVAATEGGRKALPEFPVEIHDESGDVVARVHKTLYVRRKA